MKTILFAGYPKSGNTLLGETFVLAGKSYNPEWELGEYKKLDELFDYYHLQTEYKQPRCNPLFKNGAFCIKTHNKCSEYHDVRSSFYGGVSHVITIDRNPFEVLLSSLNYFRYVYKSNNFNLSPVLVKSLELLIPEYKINQETFFDDFTLDKLREQGFLDQALINFSYNGTSIYHFYEMSGSWCSFSNAYSSHSQVGFGDGKIPVLNIKYEDMVNNSSFCSKQLGDFLDCDSKYIENGFFLQKQIASERKNKNDTFFNKMESGYWKEYFTPKLCRNFVEKYCYELKNMGYQSLIDNFHW